MTCNKLPPFEDNSGFEPDKPFLEVTGSIAINIFYQRTKLNGNYVGNWFIKSEDRSNQTYSH